MLSGGFTQNKFMAMLLVVLVLLVAIVRVQEKELERTDLSHFYERGLKILCSLAAVLILVVVFLLIEMVAASFGYNSILFS